jgi:hypothetical protein
MFCFFWLAFLVSQARGEGDFKVLLEAAKLVAAGKNPYNFWIFVSEGNYALYFYSPLWALILFPFRNLPNFIPNLLWLLANTWFLYRIWVLLTKYIDLQKLSAKQARWLLFLTLILTARYILYNIGMIQMTIFLLWGSLESLSLFGRHRYLSGSLLLALLINVKLLPVVLVPYLIYRREWKGVLCTLGFSVLFLFLPGFLIGWNTNLHLLSEWWSVINPFKPEHLVEADLGLHSLTALVPSLLAKTNGILPYARNILNLDPAAVTFILNATRIGLILLTLLFLGWPPFHKAKSGLHQLYELSYLFLLIPLIFPHQQKYEFFLAAPALFYLSYYMVLVFPVMKEIGNKRTFYAIVFLYLLSFTLMTLTTDSIIGRPLNLITQHYKTITYGAILLIIALVICKPGRSEEADELMS